MPYDADIVIIGAGVIGLAVASQVARAGREVYILERNETFGREASSRNSGTIHTSVLSPKGSLNARFCLEGNPLIYELCRKRGVPFLKSGKLLVAGESVDIPALEAVYQRQEEGIRMRWLSQREMRQIEPDINGAAAVLLPEAGVVDVHALTRCYLGLARENEAQLVCKSEVIGIEKASEGYRIQIRDSEGVTVLYSRLVINCGGLHSDRVAAMAGIQIDAQGYKLSYFKGEYYSIMAAKARNMDQRLVYPMLRPGRLMGLHTVLDVDRRVRLGPDFYQVKEIDYAIDDSRKQSFYERVHSLFPLVEYEDIEPESAGVMPRLYAADEPFKEFIIRHEQDKGLEGFINLVGIETPGVTSSPAIARYIGNMVDEML